MAATGGGGDRPRGLWSGGLKAAARAPTDWLWHGCLAAGQVTLLTGRLY
jgi:hypothetical protein